MESNSGSHGLLKCPIVKKLIFSYSQGVTLLFFSDQFLDASKEVAKFLSGLRLAVISSIPSIIVF